MDSMLTPSDVALMSGRGNGGCSDGWGDNGSWWIVLFLIFAIFGWGGYGNGGGGATPYTAGTTQADLQRGFDTQAITSKLNGLENGLCGLGYDTLGQLCNVNQNVSQTGNDIQGAIQAASTANLQNTFAIQQAINADTVANMQNANAIQAQIANCCCENREAIQGVNYNLATNTSAIQNTLCSNTRDIIDNQNAGTRAILDYLCQDKIASLQAENQALKLSASQQAQNTYLVNQLKPYPVPAFPAGQMYGYMNNPCPAHN